MWFLWILITLIVFGFSGTQVFSFIYVLLNMRGVYRETSKTKKKSMLIATTIHLMIVLTWLFLCIFIDAINRYWILMTIVWIVETIFTIVVVEKSAVDIFLSLKDDAIEEMRKKKQDSFWD